MLKQIIQFHWDIVPTTREILNLIAIGIISFFQMGLSEEKIVYGKENVFIPMGRSYVILLKM